MRVDRGRTAAAFCGGGGIRVPNRVLDFILIKYGFRSLCLRFHQFISSDSLFFSVTFIAGFLYTASMVMITLSMPLYIVLLLMLMITLVVPLYIIFLRVQ